MTADQPAPSDNDAHVATHLRDHDFDWYAALQFAPTDKRPALMALFAYLAELARIRGLVSEPMPGEIRLQWWRDTLSGTAHGDVEANPLAATLLVAMDRHSIPAAPLLAVLDGRTFDLYDDAMPSTGDLEGYAGEVWSGPISLAASLLSGHSPARFADAAGHGGVALAVARVLESFPVWAARGQCYLPPDVMEPASLKRAALQTGQPTPELADVLARFAAYGEDHLSKAVSALCDAPQAAYPAFLPLALARHTFNAAPAWAKAPFAKPLTAARWRRLYRLWRASKRMPRL